MDYDSIRLKRLVTWARVGILPWEKKRRQKVCINLRVYTDLHAAGRSGLLEDSLDYRKLEQTVCRLCLKTHYNLVENLAYSLAQALLEDPKVAGVRVDVYKRKILKNTKYCGVSICRFKGRKEQK